jgi:ABC-type uncharacterized transport system permease subunit
LSAWRARIAFRARFWNLGLEGQMVWGAIGATAVSMWQVGPEPLRLPLMFAAAIGCGLLWVLGPAWLKLKLGVNEIISTLMLNYMAANFLLHLVYGSWKDPKDNFPYSPQFRAFERLPELGAGVGSAILLAAVVALLAWWLVGVSRAGLYLRFVDANPRVAHANGVPVRRTIYGAVLLSGAMAGLAGFAVASGQEGRLTQAFYQGYGFSGILIAFLARNNPLAATVVALLVAALFVTGRSLQVFYQVPFSMVQLIQAIIVVCVAERFLHSPPAAPHRNRRQEFRDGRQHRSQLAREHTRLRGALCACGAGPHHQRARGRALAGRRRADAGGRAGGHRRADRAGAAGRVAGACDARGQPRSRCCSR